MHLLYGRETAKETEGKGRKERGSPRKEGGGREMEKREKESFFIISKQGQG